MNHYFWGNIGIKDNLKCHAAIRLLLQHFNLNLVLRCSVIYRILEPVLLYKFNFLLQCVNGTYSEETCENGLVYGEGHGSAHNFCNYNWEIDCGTKAYDDTPISSPGTNHTLKNKVKGKGSFRYKMDCKNVITIS